MERLPSARAWSFRCAGSEQERSGCGAGTQAMSGCTSGSSTCVGSLSAGTRYLRWASAERVVLWGLNNVSGPPSAGSADVSILEPDRHYYHLSRCSPASPGMDAPHLGQRHLHQERLLDLCPARFFPALAGMKPAHRLPPTRTRAIGSLDLTSTSCLRDLSFVQKGHSLSYSSSFRSLQHLHLRYRTRQQKTTSSAPA